MRIRSRLDENFSMYRHMHDHDGDPRTPEPGFVTTAGRRGRYVPPGAAADHVRMIAPGAPDSPISSAMSR